jgi:hypothetical protein
MPEVRCRDQASSIHRLFGVTTNERGVDFV